MWWRNSISCHQCIQLRFRMRHSMEFTSANKIEYSKSKLITMTQLIGTTSGHDVRNSRTPSIDLFALHIFIHISSGVAQTKCHRATARFAISVRLNLYIIYVTATTTTRSSEMRAFQVATFFGIAAVGVFFFFSFHFWLSFCRNFSSFQFFFFLFRCSGGATKSKNEENK